MKNSLPTTNLTHFFISLFITSLYMFRASLCSSSGDLIVLIHHLVWLVCVSDCLVCPDDEHCYTRNMYRCVINKDTKKCVKLVIGKELWRDARSTNFKILMKNVIHTSSFGTWISLKWHLQIQFIQEIVQALGIHYKQLANTFAMAWFNLDRVL
jgi:hypothetical protein